MLELKLYLLTWAIAIAAYTYTEILTDHGMILFRFKGWISARFEYKTEHWLYKILVGCAYCVSGQWMLWTYLGLAFVGHSYFDLLTYDPFAHLLLVLVTIFNVALIRKAGIYGNEN